jgi:hypothetical protein
MSVKTQLPPGKLVEDEGYEMEYTGAGSMQLDQTIILNFLFIWGHGTGVIIFVVMLE